MNKTDRSNNADAKYWCFKYLLIHRKDDNKLSEDGHKVQEEVDTMPSLKTSKKSL